MESDIWDNTTSRSDSEVEWPADKGDMWAHNDINSHSLFTSGGTVGLADGLDFHVGDGVHGYVCGEVRRSDGLELSDSWVIDEDMYFEYGDIVNLAEDRVICEDRGCEVTQGDVVELSDYRVVC